MAFKMNEMNEVYGEGFDEDGYMVYNMIGGCKEWLNYKVKNDEVYKEDTNGVILLCGKKLVTEMRGRIMYAKVIRK